MLVSLEKEIYNLAQGHGAELLFLFDQGRVNPVRNFDGLIHTPTGILWVKILIILFPRGKKWMHFKDFLVDLGWRGLVVYHRDVQPANFPP